VFVDKVTEAGGGGGEAERRGRTRDTESKTRTPHKDVGKKMKSTPDPVATAQNCGFVNRINSNGSSSVSPFKCPFPHQMSLVVSSHIVPSQ